MIEAETTLVGYQTYVKACTKKDVVRQRNQIAAGVVRKMCQEVGEECYAEAKA